MSAALVGIEPHSAPRPRHVSMRAAPRREPPFDDERELATKLIGAGDRPLPFDRDLSPTTLPRPSAVVLPDPAAVARALLIGLVEAAGGKRPLRQLNEHLTISVSCGIRDDLDRAARSGTRHWLHRAAVRSVHSTEPTPGVAELAATLALGPRVRAVALRMEYRHDRWRCTRLQLG